MGPQYSELDRAGIAKRSGLLNGDPALFHRAASLGSIGVRRNRASPCVRALFLAVIMTLTPGRVLAKDEDQRLPKVEIEELVYVFDRAGSATYPLWNYGGTNVVRLGGRVYMSGLERMVGAPPLNNMKCTIWERGKKGWQLVFRAPGRTMEPCPLVADARYGRLLLSHNPSLLADDAAGGGAARPEVIEFVPRKTRPGVSRLLPVWLDGTPAPGFIEHSYRSFASDARRGEAVLFHNVGYEHAEWSLLSGRSWPAQGRLLWPWEEAYRPPRSVRLCYASTALHGTAAHLLAASDIIEPDDALRELKRTQLRRERDYVLRRLFYAWTPNLRAEPFSEWLELANRDATAGRVTPGDLWVDSAGRAHLLWTEAATDRELGPLIFPQVPQRHELNYAVIARGRVVLRRTLLAADESRPGYVPHLPRFLISDRGRVFVFYYVNGTPASPGPISQNRILEIAADGSASAARVLALQVPLHHYMAAAPRGGSPKADVFDLIGTAPERPDEVRYLRLRLD